MSEWDFSYGTVHNAFVAEHWGPGYPNCQESKWVPLVAKNGVGFGRVHIQLQNLYELLLNECVDRGYPPKAGQCWGSVCRCSHRPDGSCAEDAQGRPVPSPHSYGIAIDFNSIDNPYGGATFKMPDWVPILFREYGFRWLGPPIQDWQHFDFAGTPAGAIAMTQKAREELGMTDAERAKLDRALELAREATAGLRGVEDYLDGVAPPQSAEVIRKRVYRALNEASEHPLPAEHKHPHVHGEDVPVP